MTTRSELLEWVNELLQINYSKIEQFGSGAAYCQIMDSIYRDVPMTRVKMNAKLEYEYLVNFKVLQNVFKTKKVDKPIPVDKLIKCKMQDNLEFLQWIKRFWDQNYPDIEYDPVARRKGAAADPPATIAPISSRSAGGASLGAGNRSGGRTPLGGRSSANAGVSHEVVAGLRAQIQELTATTEGLEKERDFYFSKLRDIEILVQQQVEALERDGKEEDETLQEIQKILYSTEDGFEVPEGGAPPPEDEEETF